MGIALAQAGPTQPGPALWRIAGIRELAQLDLEEMLIQRSAQAAAGAEEVARDPPAQFCVIGHPSPKLGGVRAGPEQAAVNLLSLPRLPVFPTAPRSRRCRS
jgi:hypothetical protein